MIAKPSFFADGFQIADVKMSRQCERKDAESRWLRGNIAGFQVAKQSEEMIYCIVYGTEVNLLNVIESNCHEGFEYEGEEECRNFRRLQGRGVAAFIAGNNGPNDSRVIKISDAEICPARKTIAISIDVRLIDLSEPMTKKSNNEKRFRLRW